MAGEKVERGNAIILQHLTSKEGLYRAAAGMYTTDQNFRVEREAKL
jgi:hypothetical protein